MLSNLLMQEREREKKTHIHTSITLMVSPNWCKEFPHPLYQYENITCRSKTSFCDSVEDPDGVFFGWDNKKSEREEDSRVGLKVSVVDGLDELLRDLYDLLLASCGAETQGIAEDGSTPFGPQPPSVPLTQRHLAPLWTAHCGYRNLPMSLLLIMNLISHLPFTGEWTLLPAAAHMAPAVSSLRTPRHHSDRPADWVSVLERSRLQSTCIHWPSHRHVACKAARVPHAIPVLSALLDEIYCVLPSLPLFSERKA